MLSLLVEELRAVEVVEIGVHLPGLACADAVREACASANKRIVALDTAPRVVVTADGVACDGVVRSLKDEVDAIVPGAERVFVLRLLGNAPLAPTMDAYLDVDMVPGRDVWIDER